MTSTRMPYKYNFYISLLLNEINDPYGRDGVDEASAIFYTPTLIAKFFLALEDRLSAEQAKKQKTKFTTIAKSKIMTVVKNIKHEGIHASSLLKRLGSSSSDLIDELKNKYRHIVIAQLESDNFKTQDIFGVYAEDLGISKRSLASITPEIKTIIRDLMSHRDVLHKPALSILEEINISQNLKKRVLAAYVEKITLQLEHPLKSRKIHATEMLKLLELSSKQKDKIVLAAEDTRKYSQRLWAVKSIKNLDIQISSDFIAELTEDRYPPVRIVALEIAANHDHTLSDECYVSIGHKLKTFIRWQEQCAALLVLGSVKKQALKFEVAQWIMHHYMASENKYVQVAALHALDLLKLNFEKMRWGKKNSLKNKKWKNIIAKNKKDNQKRIDDLPLIIRIRDEDMVAL